jgi:hypothetical protein
MPRGHYIRTLEHRKSMSTLKKGCSYSPEALQHMSEGQRKRVYTKEFGDKVSRALKGKERHDSRGGLYSIRVRPSRGRAYINTPTGWKLMSRWLGEKMVGRPLKRNEDVHHKNLDHSDDREENLQVMTHSEHMRLHRLLKNGK